MFAAELNLEQEFSDITFSLFLSLSPLLSSLLSTSLFLSHSLSLALSPSLFLSLPLSLSLPRSVHRSLPSLFLSPLLFLFLSHSLSASLSPPRSFSLPLSFSLFLFTLSPSPRLFSSLSFSLSFGSTEKDALMTFVYLSLTKRLVLAALCITKLSAI
ncbi:unnamed protein product [Acanthosepion pharaonis]|uniref:Uncharacterized protein n=1 Tax=Acanthosepion pharaonis TaxID=158019 RepID=A0A812EHW9_ACAPH|nr:unnamed protein product [Sepia pharaonis]